MKLRLLLLLVATSLFHTATAAEGRQKYNFSADWLLRVGDTPEAREVRYPDADWRRVTLPRPFNEDEAFRLDIHDLTDTIVWYRKHFRLPAVRRRSLWSLRVFAREPISTSTATTSVCTKTVQWPWVSTSRPT